MSNNDRALRAFQVKEIGPLFDKKRGGVAWDMGLGKTAAVSTIGARARLQRWLIVCPDNAFEVWGGSKWNPSDAAYWIKKEWPEAEIFVRFIEGSPWNRDLDWNTEITLRPNQVLLTIVTHGTFLMDWAEKLPVVGNPKRKRIALKVRKQFQIPQIMIIDEAKPFRNKKSQLYAALRGFVSHYDPQWFFPMTGTPGHQPKHFWTMLNLIDRRYFGSYWKFVYAFHEIEDGIFGKEIGAPKNLAQWHQTLGRYFSVVKEDDEGIAEQRPPLTRQLLPIDMDPDQEKLYNELRNDFMSFDAKGDLQAYVQNEFTLATRLRQVLVCPRLVIPGLGVGAHIKDFANTVEKEDHNVIFCPFTSAFPHFQEFLESKGFKVWTLQGGMGTPERAQRIQEWRDGRGVIICSILYAQAFSLEPAKRSFFVGSSWDPDDNRQAEKRLLRLTTQYAVNAYYYTFRSSFDYRLNDILNIKQEHTDLTIPGNLRNLLNVV